MLISLLALEAKAQIDRYDLSECSGIYAKPDFNTDGQISIKFKPIASKGLLSLAAFKFQDRSKFLTDSFIGDFVICSRLLVEGGMCNPDELGKFHLQQPANVLNEKVAWGSGNGQIPPEKRGFYKRQQSISQSPTPTASPASTATPSPSAPTPTPPAQSKTPLLIQDTKLEFTFPINETGYYCVVVSNQGLQNKKDFDVEIIIKNPYGYLPALFYPTLPFFKTIAIIYFTFGAIWMFLSWRYWKDLLPLQHFISYVVLFLFVEMMFNYAFYADFNNTGKLSNFWLGIVTILNAGRISISFFMLLIVSLGYGVVKPTLGDTMKRCVALGIIHFLFGAVYASGAVNSAKENPLVVLFLAIPVTISMSIFYFWTLTALEDTMKHLEERRQFVKLNMYKNLQYILMLSVVLILGIIIANSVNMSHRTDETWIINQWKWRWMLMDGFLNIVYLIIFVMIVILWRPTENNERYGLDQLATDDPDEDFEEFERGIKLKSLKDEYDDDDETADDILQWVEDHVGGNPFEESRSK